MKKSISILMIIALSSGFCFAQEKTELIFNDKKEVFLNGKEVNNLTSFETIKSILGEPVLYKEYPTGKVNYHYKDLGVAVHIVDDKLLFIGANFNWDGDKTFPESSFTGMLEIDGVIFDQTSDRSNLEKIETIEINCIIPNLCMTNPKTEKKRVVVVGFKDEKLTQVGFEFH